LGAGGGNSSSSRASTSTSSLIATARSKLSNCAVVRGPTIGAGDPGLVQ
jgi:hypothetical protein